MSTEWRWAHGKRIEVVTVESPDDGRTKATKAPPEERFFGCPIWWLRAVLPVVKSKGELVVAMYLFRLRHVTKNKTVVAPNKWLKEMGIDRRRKYRALARLERAGLVVVERHGKAAPEVTFLR
jgi:hypothetical protein